MMINVKMLKEAISWGYHCHSVPLSVKCNVKQLTLHIHICYIESAYLIGSLTAGNYELLQTRQVDKELCHFICTVTKDACSALYSVLYGADECMLAVFSAVQRAFI